MSDLKMNAQLGTKWFTFYTKVRPWLACLSFFSVLSDFIQYTNVYVSNWWMLLLFAGAVAQSVLCVIVAVKSSGNYASFVRFVKRVLAFETINMAYQQGVQQYIQNDLDISVAVVVFLVILTLGYFIWYRLNIKYFEKRMGVIVSDYLEDDPNRVTECLSCGYRNPDFFDACPKCGEYRKRYVYLNQEAPVEESKICFCRKCGHKLIDDSRFCSKCGTEVVKE